MPVSTSLEFKSIFCKINQYLNDNGKLTDALENSFAVTRQPLRITTCGLLKAGKSSLLNVLTDHLETELFATGSVRTTVRNQTLSQQNFIFVDTPGLDATEEDDAEAWGSLNIADVLLFVHDPGTGELHFDEINFLEKIATQTSDYINLEARLVVVLTRLDSTPEINAISETIRRQIKDCLGFDPHQFRVSCTSYRKGKLHNKVRLVEYSGIPALRQYLLDNLENMRSTAQTLRRARIRASRKELMNAIVAAITKRKEKITLIQDESNQTFQSLARDSEIFLNTLRSKIAAYDENH